MPAHRYKPHYKVTNNMLPSILLGLCLLFSHIASANEDLLQNLYIAPQTQTKPEALIFYNSANPCENCEKAINLTINILRQNFSGKLHAYLINLNQHPEFITAFKLKGPLSLVIVRIDDGASFGYTKLESLQTRITSTQDYKRELIEFINNFLGFD